MLLLCHSNQYRLSHVAVVMSVWWHLFISTLTILSSVISVFLCLMTGVKTKEQSFKVLKQMLKRKVLSCLSPWDWPWTRARGWLGSKAHVLWGALFPQFFSSLPCVLFNWTTNCCFCLSQVDFVLYCFSFACKLEVDFDNSSSIVIATLLMQVSKGWYYALGTLIFDIWELQMRIIF